MMLKTARELVSSKICKLLPPDGGNRGREGGNREGGDTEDGDDDNTSGCDRKGNAYEKKAGEEEGST